MTKFRDMARKKLTPEQESEIKVLLANNDMLEKTKREAQERKGAVKQIERAQQEVIDHINSIDPDALANHRKTVMPKQQKQISQDHLFDEDMSIFDILKENEEQNAAIAKTEETKVVQKEDLSTVDEIVPKDSTTVDDRAFNDVDPSQQYDIIQLPSNGQTYKSKIDRVPVAYLTAYDENMITSPNLYRDGLVIDFLLKNKIMNKSINVDELVSGDADAIILFLRATSYGPDFPIVVNDPDTGEQIETTVDLTTLKPKDFKLVGDENGWFEYETPVRKDKIKFRYLTRKQEKQLRQITELEGNGTKGHMIERERDELTAALANDKALNENEKKTIRASLEVMKNWSKRLLDANDSDFTKIMTNNLQLQVMAVNGNTDRDFIRKYIYAMPARDSLMLRRYINENRPGIDFEIEVQRPESLGGGSFKTFLNWDDSVFLNIADV